MQINRTPASIVVAILLVSAMAGFAGSLLRERIDPSLGTSIATPVASFETSLAYRISDTATTMTLVSTTTDDGTKLVPGNIYGFTIDEGTPVLEYVIGYMSTSSGSSDIVYMTRGVSTVTGSSSVTALRKAHGRGAIVKITDAPVVLQLANILNGRDTIPNALAYDSSVSTSSLAAGSGQALASVDLVNYVGSSGCADATVSVRGCSEIATLAEVAAGTSLGGTGATLVVPASAATSSPGSNATNQLVATNGLGKIARDFIGSTLHYIMGSLNVGNSTTTNATSSSFAILTGKFHARGVDYLFPSADGAANSVLSTNGSGVLAWSSIQSLVQASSTVAATTTSTSINNTNVETTYDSTGTVTIPAGKMGVAGTLKMRAVISDLDFVNSATANNEITFKFKLGGTTVCELAAPDATNGGSNLMGEVVCEVHNKNSASSQVTLGHLMAVNNQGATAGAKTKTSAGVASINTAVAQQATLTVQWTVANSGNTITVAGFSATVY